MSKKHWIFIKRGLSEDPKHRAQMGECIWLFMHIIDRADWETGIAYDWRDSEEAAAMSMPVETLRDQRQKLEKLDYIRCKQRQHGQDVRIMEWRNPREYDSVVRNPRSQGDGLPLPSEFQGDAQGDAQGCRQTTTPTLDSYSESSLREMGLEWLLLSGKPVTEEMVQKAKVEKEAKDQFEKVFGFGTLPWGSNTVWTKFQKFVVARHMADPGWMADYVAWRKDGGKYMAYSNRKIRENPAAFMD